MISRHQVRWPLTMLGAFLIADCGIADCGLWIADLYANITGNKQVHLSALDN
jgi:hypothetical protein